MILKTYPNRNMYGNYFLATEAPDDEETEVTEDQPKPRRNVKVISVKPSNRGKDFTQVGNPPITPDTTEVEDDVDLDDTDYSAEDNQPTEQNDETPVETDADVEQPTETPDNNETTEPTVEGEEPETTPDDAPDTGEDDNTDFTGDDTPDETGETGEDGPDVGGDEDFTDGSEETQDTQDTNDDTTGGDGNDTPNAPGVELDSTRKYNLYKEFMSLYNATDNYISKLENILKNDYEENQIIRISVNNLREIKDILFDYMTIRFQLNTYVQSLLFYQKMVVSVQLVFKLLKSINPVKKK